MKTRLITILVLLCFVFSLTPLARSITHVGVKIYLAPQDGFETYLAAAFTKKHVAATIVGDPERADYILEAAPVNHRPESAGSKIARCLFVYCAGIEGTESGSVRLIDAKSKDTVWSYTVNKGHQREQSLAEAVAKHINNEFINR